MLQTSNRAKFEKNQEIITCPMYYHLHALKQSSALGAGLVNSAVRIPFDACDP